MRNIFTIAYSEEEANEIGHFIMSKGYEGVQNDSYRYCDIMIDCSFRENKEHHKDHIYVGVNAYLCRCKWLSNGCSKDQKRTKTQRIEIH